MNEVKGEDMLYAKVNKLTMKEVFSLLFFLFLYAENVYKRLAIWFNWGIAGERLISKLNLSS